MRKHRENLSGFTAFTLSNSDFGEEMKKRGWATHRHINNWCRFYDSRGRVIGKLQYYKTKVCAQYVRQSFSGV